MATYASLKYNYDASGLSSLPAGDRSPMFCGWNTSTDGNFGNATWHVPTMGDETYDSDSCFNDTGSTVTLNSLSVPAYSFCPNVSGWYYIAHNIGGNGQYQSYMDALEVAVYKNGAIHMSSFQNQGNNSDQNTIGEVGGLIELNGTGDYLTPYIYVDTAFSGGTNASMQASSSTSIRNAFSGFKVS